jgi:hypothetical protein
MSGIEVLRSLSVRLGCVFWQKLGYSVYSLSVHAESVQARELLAAPVALDEQYNDAKVHAQFLDVLSDGVES